MHFEVKAAYSGAPHTSQVRAILCSKVWLILGCFQVQVHKMVVLASSSRVSKQGAEIFFGMRNTDHWMPAARAPYLAHYSEDYLRTQWAALSEVVLQVYECCGGRFPCDYVLPNITVPTLIMNGGQDRFCGDPKACFLSVLKNVR
ncbi:hypothetical protein COOONC_20849 [Cooperia oncophora]